MASLDLSHFKPLEIRLVNRIPNAVQTNQNPKALKAIQATALQSTGAPLRWTLEIPATTASRTIPKTSSSTAPDRIVTPSGVDSFLFSLRIRAVIPTDVAVDSVPKKSWEIGLQACQKKKNNRSNYGQSV